MVAVSPAPPTTVHTATADSAPARPVQALAGSRADVQTFTSGGWHAPFEADERVRAYRLLKAGGPTTRTAAQKALDGSAEDNSCDSSAGADQLTGHGYHPAVPASSVKLSQ